MITTARRERCFGPEHSNYDGIEKEKDPKQRGGYRAIIPVDTLKHGSAARIYQSPLELRSDYYPVIPCLPFDSLPGVVHRLRVNYWRARVECF